MNRPRPSGPCAGCHPVQPPVQPQCSPPRAAPIQDRDGGELVLGKTGTRFGRLAKIWVDGGYAGRFVKRAKPLFKRDVEVVKKKEGPGFQVLPKRWVVERTSGWLNKHRRLSKDHEHLTGSAEAMLHLAMIRLVLGRLAR